MYKSLTSGVLQQDAEVERARLAEWDKFLLVRYSSVDDIDAA